MKRSNRIVIVAHCILNSNSKVLGLSQYPGGLSDIIIPIINSGAGIIQLPCPEMTFIGPKRWGMTREQYDTSNYRNHCREILLPYVFQIQDYLQNGYSIEEVIGVDGSPTCGVNHTCIGYTGGEWNKSESQYQDLREIPGKGIMIEILQTLLSERNLNIPFSAIDETKLTFQKFS